MLYKYVYDSGFVVWKMIHLHEDKRLLYSARFLGDVQVCRSFTWNMLSRESDPSCMMTGFSLYPVTDSTFSWIKENTPSLWPSKRCLTQLSVDHNDSLHVNTFYHPFLSPSHECPDTTTALPFWTKTAWWSVYIPQDKGRSPASSVRSKSGGPLPTPYFVIMVSCYAISREILPLTNSISGCLRVLPGLPPPPPLHTLNKRFDKWRTSFLCQQRLEWLCCTCLCTTHTWASWEIYIFVFPILLYIYWHSCVM